MSEYLKKAVKTAATDDTETRSVVEVMLNDIRQRRESAVREYAAKLDRWDKDVVVPAEQVSERIKEIPQSVRDDFSSRGTRSCSTPQLMRRSTPG